MEIEKKSQSNEKNPSRRKNPIKANYDCGERSWAITKLWILSVFMIIEIVCARGKRIERKTDSIMRWTLHESLTVVLERTFSTFYNCHRDGHGKCFNLHLTSAIDDIYILFQFPALQKISNMSQLNLIALSLVLMVSSSCGVIGAPANGDSELCNMLLPEISSKYLSISDFPDSIKELYDYLLQREYAEPLSLDHQMERKAVRSPSLRLRFGRRSDPDVPLIRRVSENICSAFIWLSLNFVSCCEKQENEIDNEIEQKSIRSPSMRLRFGRRNDPMMPLFNEVNIRRISFMSIRL